MDGPELPHAGKIDLSSYCRAVLFKYTSSVPPKLAHIFRAKKQRTLLEILYANITSRENRTREGYSRFDIIHF